jgi:hypothetical protein
VDKAWQRKGLKEYSVESILGTLSHYGLKVDEAHFRQLAEKLYPTGIAEEWQPRWKGTGQFAAFPRAAAEELWRRWLPDRLTPYAVAEALAKLMGSLGELLQGSQEAAVGPAFAAMDAARKGIPLTPAGTPDETFIHDALSLFDPKAVQAFDNLAEMLARQGHMEDAEAFADLEEFLLPERKGVARSIVRVIKGEREPAVEELRRLAGDDSRSSASRVLAVDALLHVGAYSEAAGAGRPLMEAAEKAGDLHLALDLCARLQEAYKRLNDHGAQLALQRDLARLEAAHDVAHPGHRHHRH